MKPTPVSAMQVATASGLSMMFAPRDSSTSALPERDDTERLPCLATRAPAAPATNIDAVEMLNVCEASPPVPTMSRRCSRSATSTLVENSRITCAAAAISPIVSFLTRRPTVSAAIITGDTSPLMIRRMIDSISSWKISRCSIVRCSASWSEIVMTSVRWGQMGDADSRLQRAHALAREIDATGDHGFVGARPARVRFLHVGTLRSPVLPEILHRFRERGVRTRPSRRALERSRALRGCGFSGVQFLVCLAVLVQEAGGHRAAISGGHAFLEGTCPGGRREQRGRRAHQCEADVHESAMEI